MGKQSPWEWYFVLSLPLFVCVGAVGNASSFSSSRRWPRRIRSSLLVYRRGPRTRAPGATCSAAGRARCRTSARAGRSSTDHSFLFCVQITLHPYIDHARVAPAPPEQGVSTDIARERRGHDAPGTHARHVVQMRLRQLDAPQLDAVGLGRPDVVAQVHGYCPRCRLAGAARGAHARRRRQFVEETNGRRGLRYGDAAGQREQRPAVSVKLDFRISGEALPQAAAAEGEPFLRI